MPRPVKIFFVYFKTFLKKILILSLVSLVLFPNITVNAATYTQAQTCAIPTQLTNWNLSCSVPKFNPNLGELTSIRFEITGNIDSIAKVENKDAANINVTANVNGSITLSRPDNTTLVGVLPAQSDSDIFPTFDGIIDFSGTSGKTFPNLVASQSNSLTSTSQADFTLFTGTDNIALPVNASGTSNFSGSANLATSVDTKAGASVNVIYSYLAQNLSINKTHVGVLTAGNNATYTITVNNLESEPSIGTITVVDTLPTGMSYISNTNTDWACIQVLQTLTCTSSAVILANKSPTFNITVSTIPAIASQVTNTAQVSSSYVDPVLNNNRGSDLTIINHLPVVNNLTIAPVLNTGAQLLSSAIFGGNANDVGDSLQNFTILTLPSATLGVLYLGNPATTGVAITSSQVLSLTDITNVYFLPVLGAVGSATFNFTTVDSFSGIPNLPATITIPISSAPKSNSGNTTVLTQMSAQNQNSVITEKTSIAPSDSANTALDQKLNQNRIPTQQNAAVLGVSDSVTKVENQLIRTGFEHPDNIFKKSLRTSIKIYLSRSNFLDYSTFNPNLIPYFEVTFNPKPTSA